MLIVRVELWSAITGRKTEIARMRIYNDGSGDHSTGNYVAESFRGRDAETLEKGTVQRIGEVKEYPRLRLHVWNLVSRALTALRYVE